MEHTRDHSTYSAIFAVVFIVLLILIIAYNTGQKLYTDWRETINQPNYPSQPGELEPLVPEGTVLYENLTNEEADRIIRELLQPEHTTTKDIASLESSLLQ